jgi:hypothetical protein
MSLKVNILLEQKVVILELRLWKRLWEVEGTTGIKEGLLSTRGTALSFFPPHNQEVQSVPFIPEDEQPVLST